MPGNTSTFDDRTSSCRCDFNALATAYVSSPTGHAQGQVRIAFAWTTVGRQRSASSLSSPARSVPQRLHSSLTTSKSGSHFLLLLAFRRSVPSPGSSYLLQRRRPWLRNWSGSGGPSLVSLVAQASLISSPPLRGI